MPEFRVALTVLPVGPRDVKHVPAEGERWFALQISAGFADQPDKPAEHVASLWPWVVHVLDAGEIKLRAWLLGTGGPVGFDLVAKPTVAADFAKHLRDQVQDQYEDPDVLKGLDLRVLYPGEGNDEYWHRSFAARLQYLATLPGDLSMQLLATIYVAIPVKQLFDIDSGTGQPTAPKAETLWIAPSRLNVLQKPVSYAGDPTAHGGGTALFDLSYDTLDSVAVKALGPGFKLARLLKAETDRVFDLATYWMPVASGDRRFEQVEGAVFDALDPFRAIDAVEGWRLQEKAQVQPAAGKPIALTAEAATAAGQAWKVDALAGALAEARVKALVLATARRWLQRPDASLPWLTRALTEEWWCVPAQPIVSLAAKLAAGLRLAPMKARDQVADVAATASFRAQSAWLRSSYEAALAAANPTDPEERKLLERLRDESRNADEQRRQALAAIVVRERQDAGPVATLVDQLRGYDPKNHGQDPGAFLRARAAAAIAEEWKGRFGRRVSAALANLELIAENAVLVVAGDAAESFTKEHLDRCWALGLEPAHPELPGHGLALLVGEARDRLAHWKDKAQEAPGGEYGEVAGISLLARRSDSDDLKGKPWRLVTGGAAVAGSLGDELFTRATPASIWLDRLLALPVRPVFEQQVRRADLQYHGQPMLARDPLDRGYAGSDLGVQVPTFESAYTFESLGDFRQHADLAEASLASAAPVLRDGDWYQFAAAVIDQSGGLPVELAAAGAPWRIDPKKLLAAGDLSKMSKPIQRLRRTAVGDIAVLTTMGRTSEGKDRREDWPAILEGVVLRAPEWLSASGHATERVPVLLHSKVDTPHVFELHPPSVEEHTLVPWAAPALGSAEAPEFQKKIEAAVTRLVETRRKRAEELAATEDGAPAAPVTAQDVHDPAVSAMGIRVRFADPAGNLRELPPVVFPLLDDAIPFRRKPVVVTTRAVGWLDAGAPFPTPTIDLATSRLELSVPQGWFVAIESSPLVSDADWQRFGPPELFAGLVEAPGTWAGHVGFRPTKVLVESATERLPEPKDLLEHLKLEERGGRIHARFDGDPVHLPFVSEYTLVRERWVWRNRPVLREGKLTGGPEEQRRLAASGPPEEVFDPTKRDEAPAVLEWEELAALDRGFVERGRFTAQWPRRAPDEKNTGGSRGPVELLVDDRDGMTAADYLRYRLMVRSRYAPVLGEKGRVETSAWRRIVVPFRGEVVRPPKPLALLPLTRSLADDPLPAAAPGTTPFLVLLDETWFREYGVGERLEVRVALENADLGETPDARRPYRTGPLPDHRVPTSWDAEAPYADDRYFLRTKVTAADDEANPVRLTAFGPFGYTLDVSPDEALANATAFVVHPHDEMGAHWALSVRMRRVLQFAGGKPLESESTDVHAVYTLPDSELLARPENPKAPELARAYLKGIGGKVPTIRVRDLRLLLDPVALPGTKDAARNSLAAHRYRYLLLVSQVVTGAGHGRPIELPLALWRLLPIGYPPRVVPAETHPVELSSGAEWPIQELRENGRLDPRLRYQARVVEVLVNGEYPGASRLDRPEEAGSLDLTMHEFWSRLLPPYGSAALEQDAAGTIRRISNAFPVELEAVTASSRR